MKNPISELEELNKKKKEEMKGRAEKEKQRREEELKKEELKENERIQKKERKNKLLEQKELEKAYSVMDKKRSKDAEWHYIKGNVLREIGYFRLAMEEYALASKIDHHDVEYKKAMLIVQQNFPIEGKNTFTIKQLDPEKKFYLKVLGLERLRERNENSLQVYLSDAWGRKGETYSKEREIKDKEREKLFNRELSGRGEYLISENPQWHYTLGNVHVKMYEFWPAMVEYSKALAFEPENPFYKNALIDANKEHYTAKACHYKGDFLIKKIQADNPTSLIAIENVINEIRQVETYYIIACTLEPATVMYKAALVAVKNELLRMGEIKQEIIRKAEEERDRRRREMSENKYEDKQEDRTEAQPNYCPRGPDGFAAEGWKNSW